MLKTRLEKFYEKVVCEDLVLLYNLKNIYTLPVFDKAILNSTSKTFISEKEALLQQYSAFFLQTGILPVKTRAHKSIALFNIRQGNILGLKTTLRKQTLYNYLDKSLIFVIPKALASTNLQNSIPSLPRLDRKFLVAPTTITKNQLSSDSKNKTDFVISEKRVTRFPEVSSLLLFFNSTTGFSLDCSLSLYGQKDLPKSKLLSSKKKKDIGCNKKKLFISAFGYPQLRPSFL